MKSIAWSDSLDSKTITNSIKSGHIRFTSGERPKNRQKYRPEICGDVSEKQPLRNKNAKNRCNCWVHLIFMIRPYSLMKLKILKCVNARKKCVFPLYLDEFLSKINVIKYIHSSRTGSLFELSDILNTVCCPYIL